MGGRRQNNQLKQQETATFYTPNKNTLDLQATRNNQQQYYSE